MYKRVTDQQSKDYSNKIFVWILLSDALSEDEHLHAAAIYEKFSPVIDESVTEIYLLQFESSLEFKREYGAQQ